MSDTVLVTGADGFVGRHLVPALEAAGYRVQTHRRQTGDLASDPIRLPPVAHVIHLAGRTFVPSSWEQPSAFYRDNVLATATVLDYCRQSGARLIHVSSYVYGEPQSLPIAETHPLQPFNPYAHSKILAEDVVRFYGTHAGVRATVIRPFNLYGSGQDDRFVIPMIVRQAVDRTAPAIVIRDGRPRRDFLHVRDMVALLLAALCAEPGGPYNAGSGRSVSVAEVAALVRELAGVDKPVRVEGEPRAHEILDVVADISRARAELAWAPRVDLREGLRETVEWMARRLAA